MDPGSGAGVTTQVRFAKAKAWTPHPVRGDSKCGVTTPQCLPGRYLGSILSRAKAHTSQACELCCCPSPLHGKVQRHHCSALWGVVETQLTLVLFCDGFADGKAQTQAIQLGGEKGLACLLE
jgi:hypothetical protein